MAQGPRDTILVAIRITVRIRESKVRNSNPPDRRRFVLSEHIFLVFLLHLAKLSTTLRSLKPLILLECDCLAGQRGWLCQFLVLNQR